MKILQTPNPNALKIELDETVIEEGKASFKDHSECEHVPLAKALYELRGVDQLHFFQKTITISKFSFEPWDHLLPQVEKVLEQQLKNHHPNFNQRDLNKIHLTEDLKKIENILDEKIRPYLQSDGGDLVCLSYERHVLLVKYEGACGTCPSSTLGTLEAIKNILREEFDPMIEVYIAP